jgi:hypothetical protein
VGCSNPKIVSGQSALITAIVNLLRGIAAFPNKGASWRSELHLCRWLLDINQYLNQPPRPLQSPTSSSPPWPDPPELKSKHLLPSVSHCRALPQHLNHIHVSSSSFPWSLLPTQTPVSWHHSITSHCMLIQQPLTTWPPVCCWQSPSQEARHTLNLPSRPNLRVRRRGHRQVQPDRLARQGRLRRQQDPVCPAPGHHSSDHRNP